MSREVPRVLILNNETERLCKRLTEVMPDVAVETCESYAGVHELVPRFRPDVVYSVTFAGRAGYPRAPLLGPGGPRWIAVGGSGVDHLESWDASKVTVTNSAGSASAMMAEYVMGTILHYTLDIDGLARDKAARHWNPSRTVQPIKGKTMLIVGLGHTGQAVAQRAKAFEMRVIGTRARPEPTAHVDEVHTSADLPELWERADFVTICVPLLPSTRDLVDARAFAAMKTGAILVDVSRGGVVNQDALVNALRSGAIAHAALDVFSTEPLPEVSPVWTLENAIISPHCSAVYDDWAMHSFEMFLDNLRRWRAGEPLINIVDPARGY